MKEARADDALESRSLCKAVDQGISLQSYSLTCAKPLASQLALHDTARQELETKQPVAARNADQRVVRDKEALNIHPEFFGTLMYTGETTGLHRAVLHNPTHRPGAANCDLSNAQVHGKGHTHTHTVELRVSSRMSLRRVCNEGPSSQYSCHVQH